MEYYLSEDDDSKNNLNSTQFDERMSELAEQIEEDDINRVDSSTWRKMIFGVGGYSSGVIRSVTSLFQMAFFLEVIMLRAVWVGNILLIRQIFDALNDPIIAVISDNYQHSKYGRRKVFIYVFLLPACFLWALSWVSPEFIDLERDFNAYGKAIYFLAILLLFSIVLTFVNVPYQSLIPDISATKHGRTDTVMFYQMWTLIGSISCAVIWSFLILSYPQPIVVEYYDPDTQITTTTTTTVEYDYKRGYAYAGVVTSILIFITIFIGTLAVKERKYYEEPMTFFYRIMRMLSELYMGTYELLTFLPFLLVTTINICSQLATTFFLTNFYLWNKYVLHSESHTTTLIICLEGSVLVSFFIWTLVSKKIDKHNAYIIGALFWLATMFILYFFHSPSFLPWLYILIIFRGLGAGVNYLIPAAMLPDVIEMDEIRTGKRREALFYSIFLLTEKFGVAFAQAMSSYILAGGGYINPEDLEESNQVEQSSTVILLLRIMVTLIPAGFLIMAIIAANIYPRAERKYYSNINGENQPLLPSNAFSSSLGEYQQEILNPTWESVNKHH